MSDLFRSKPKGGVRLNREAQKFYSNLRSVKELKKRREATEAGRRWKLVKKMAKEGHVDTDLHELKRRKWKRKQDNSKIPGTEEIQLLLEAHETNDDKVKEIIGMRPIETVEQVCVSSATKLLLMLPSCQSK